MYLHRHFKVKNRHDLLLLGGLSVRGRHVKFKEPRITFCSVLELSYQIQGALPFPCPWIEVVVWGWTWDRRDLDEGPVLPLLRWVPGRANPLPWFSILTQPSNTSDSPATLWTNSHKTGALLGDLKGTTPLEGVPRNQRRSAISSRSTDSRT